jgi:hypothetical protein
MFPLRFQAELALTSFRPNQKRILVLPNLSMSLTFARSGSAYHRCIHILIVTISLLSDIVLIRIEVLPELPWAGRNIEA